MSPSGSGVVHVQFIAYGLLGSLATLDGGNVTVGQGLGPDGQAGHGASPAEYAARCQVDSIKLTAVSGSVEVDDLYIDPFLAR